MLTGGNVLEMQQLVTQVEGTTHSSATLEIVRRTLHPRNSLRRLAPRGSQMLYRAAQAMSFLDGRGFCVPEDFKPLAIPVFAHRVAIHGMNSSGMKKSVRAEEVIQEIVDSVPVPV